MTRALGRRRWIMLATAVAAVVVIVWAVRSPRPPGKAVGGPDGCMACHADAGDPGPSHPIAALGCRVCHLGDGDAKDAATAHAGMVRFPGNLDVAMRTCGTCHAEAVAHVRASPMATGRGMVAVNRFAFGEAATPDGDDTIAELGDSPADQHFRQLCAACHLGTPRTEHRPIDEHSLGGGCAACHLDTGASGHSRLVLHPPDTACAGCHSGSSRISLSYTGWHETTLGVDEAHGRPDLRVLDEDRVLARMPADVHHRAGLACIDCHTPREVMGDGRTYRHAEDAVEIRCVDCHRRDAPPTASGAALDRQTHAILRLDPRLPGPESGFVLTARGLPLVNVVADAAGIAVHGKHSGRVHRAMPPAAACAAPGHERLACQSCHAGWAPQCLGCHTRREDDGLFREYEGAFLAEPPTLAVRGERIVPAVPGMIMQLDDGRGERLVRLFSPIAPHTTQRTGRTCNSCHADPVALGWGRGALSLGNEGEPIAFEPRYQRLSDGLPADAWIHPREPHGARATRTDLRPLDHAEQDRILRVGACLACHPGDHAMYRDFAAAVEHASSARGHPR